MEYRAIACDTIGSVAALALRVAGLAHMVAGFALRVAGLGRTVASWKF